MSTKKPSTVFVPFRSEVSELKLGVENDNRPFATVDVMGVKLVGLLDSGAQISILGAGSEKLVRRLRLKLLPTTTKVSTAGGFPLEVLGYVNLPITFNEQTKIVTTLVAPSLRRRLLLGMNFWRMFNIEPTIQEQLEGVADTLEVDVDESEEGGILTAEQQEKLEAVKRKFKVFREGDKLGVTPLISHTIEFTDEFKAANPVRLNPYPWSPEVQKYVNEELDKWIESGVVEKSNSEWAMLIVPVVKKTVGEDGEPNIKVRMCLDARKLNE